MTRAFLSCDEPDDQGFRYEQWFIFLGDKPAARFGDTLGVEPTGRFWDRLPAAGSATGLGGPYTMEFVTDAQNQTALFRDVSHPTDPGTGAPIAPIPFVYALARVKIEDGWPANPALWFNRYGADGAAFNPLRHEWCYKPGLVFGSPPDLDKRAYLFATAEQGGEYNGYKFSSYTSFQLWDGDEYPENGEQKRKADRVDRLQFPEIDPAKVGPVTIMNWYNAIHSTLSGADEPRVAACEVRVFRGDQIPPVYPGAAPFPP